MEAAWGHQLEAFARAQEEDLILNLPTNSGKTLVACLLLDHCKAPGAVSLFAVNSRALLKQQTEYLQRHCQKCSVGEPGPPHPDVVVATGEVLRQALAAGQFPRLSCVVLDEAHYASGRHPYAEVMRLLPEPRPKILGLTASFLHGRVKAGCERRLHDLEQLLRARTYCPELPAREVQFFSVPWSSERVEVAGYEAKMEILLQQCDVAMNWEFRKALEEKSRLRGALEAVGPTAYHSFVCYALPEIMMSKLQSKLSAVEERSELQSAMAAIRPFQLQLLSLAEQVEGLTAKMETLLLLLKGLSSEHRTLIFVERVAAACCMAKLLSQRGWRALHVAGVQGMESSARELHLKSFREGGCQVLVATASLEEGLDVPQCRYVIRYDSFSSAKSHVQGAGRARHPEAQVFYFDNDPQQEEETRLALEAVARGYEGQLPVPKMPQGHQEWAPGVGTGHRWGSEATLWDYQSNKSFRGMACGCGARLKISSRAYGQGRKKKERSFTLEGPKSCSHFADALDARFQAVDPVTGILRE